MLQSLDCKCFDFLADHFLLYAFHWELEGPPWRDKTDHHYVTVSLSSCFGGGPDPALISGRYGASVFKSLGPGPGAGDFSRG